MLQDHSLKVKKHATRAIPARKCHVFHLVYYSFPVQIPVIPVIPVIFCNIFAIFCIKKNIAQKNAVAIFFGILKKTCDNCGLVYTAVSVAQDWFRWAQKGPKWSKTLGLTILVPFKPFWTTLERVQNTKKGPKSNKSIVCFFWDTLQFFFFHSHLPITNCFANCSHRNDNYSS